jgi:hypothetical protein
MRWEYLTASGWWAFEPVIDQTYGFTRDGEVLLRKVCGPPLARGTVNGIESFWIRARVDRPLAMPGSGVDQLLPRLDTVRARVSLTHPGLAPDAVFNDGLRLDPSKDFRPLGTEPVLGSSFVVACDEAFKRAGARIRLTIEPSSTTPVTYSTSPALVWEYSTPGRDSGWTELFRPTGEILQNGARRDVRFVRPANWEPATVAGQRHHWVRVRLAGGDYGRTRFGADGGLVGSGPQAPMLARMSVSYQYDTGLEALDHVLSLNRFDFADWTEAARFGRDAFAPFEPVPDRQPATYLGFDAPLPVGLVGLFADAAAASLGDADTRPSPFAWEYRSTDGWTELPVLDETNGFRQRGTIQFVGQPDLVPDAGPDRELYWVRARLKAATATPDPLPLASLHLNAVWATNRGTVRREIVGNADGSPGQAYSLRRPPVLPAETIEVQEWRGTGREWESLLAGIPDADRRLDRDASGRVVSVWVRWRERPHLYSSGREDRHYQLDRTTGMLRFGDGRLGRCPPPGAPIAATYRFGGGSQGNLPAGTLTQLHSAVPYVESVTNPVTAAGGAAAERAASVPSGLRHPPVGRGTPRPGAGVWARGPHRLRHRDRALSTSDYEWLAREASAEVAQARCHGGVGPDGEHTPGWVTVVVMPWGTDPEPQPSWDLLGRVHRYLVRRAPAAVAGHIRVVGPRYQPVSVVAEVLVGDPGRAAEVEERLRAGLSTFLHPLGGRDGAGWNFGEPVHLSNIASVVESTPGVEYATKLALTAEGVAFGETVHIEPERLPASGRHLVTLRLRG